MTKHKIWIKVVPQIKKDLVKTLVSCDGIFEYNGTKSSFFILDVTAFNFDGENSDGMYRIQIETNNNTKDIFISKENLLEFTVHF